MSKYNVKLSFSDPHEINKNAIVVRANRTIRDYYIMIITGLNI